MKLGKQPATYDRRDLLFASYRAKRLPDHPARFGHTSRVRGWSMLGNDRAGDCVFAGAAHETMLWNAIVGRRVRFSTAAVLGDYAALTGYDPATGSGDNGTNMREALGYRRSTGVADAAGKRHKIAAYVALEPGNWDHLLEAVWLFGAVGVGIQFPDSAMDQFDTRREWTVRPGASIEGGHYVPVMAFDRHLVCVTWGRLQAISKRFFTTYCDEAFVSLSTEMLDSRGRSAEHFDVAALQADLAGL